MSYDLVVGTLVLAQASPTVSIGLLVLGLVLFALGAYLTWSANQTAATYRAKLDELEQEKEQLKQTSSSTPKAAKTKAEPTTKAKASAAPSLDEELKAAKAAQDSLRKELDSAKASLSSAKDENKTLREQKYNADQELSELRKKDKESRERRSADSDSNAQEALINLRLELSDAKGESAIQRERVRELEAQLKALKEQGQGKKRGKKDAEEAEAQAPAPVATPAPVAAEAAPAVAPAAASNQEDLDKLTREISSLKAQLNNLSNEKDGLERELREKLKRSARKVEDERRRADNNDKAYLITQRELDASRERYKLIEERLNRAEFAAEAAIGAIQAQASAPVAEDAATQDAHDDAQDTVLDADALRQAIHGEPEGLAETSTVDEAWADLEDEL